MRRVLLIAYHFPPYQGSSGNLRTLSLCRYLPEYGWEPIVLTAHPRAYSRTDPGQLDAIPETLTLSRAFALDVRKQLSIMGKYPIVLAQPDRWASWWLGAVPAGLRMIRRYRPAAIWSTYPIATAHMIGHTLAALSGLPWVADFRDPMNDTDVRGSALSRRVRHRIERKTIRACARAVFTTAGAARMYAERYPGQMVDHWQVVPNGYDEEDFAGLGEAGGPAEAARGAPLRLVHSGYLYRPERDPDPFFEALAELRRAGDISGERLKIILRASGHEAHYSQRIKELGIGEIVKLEPALPYRGALAEMCRADGLLLFQGAQCNRQIPAKAYEYLRARRPVFALADARGDTAGLLGSAGMGPVVDITSRAAIMSALPEFMEQLGAGKAPVPSEEEIRRHSRHARVGQYARLFDDIAG